MRIRATRLFSIANPNGFRGPVPTLDLDFLAMTVAGTLDPRITYIRTGSGIYFDSAGIMQTVGANAPRLTYDPTTLQPAGLILEPAATNLFRWSQQLDDPVWVWVNGTGVRTQGATDPAGGATAWTVEDNSATARLELQQSATLTAAVHTASIYVRKTTGVQATYPVIWVISGSSAALYTLNTSTGVATRWTAYTGLTVASSTVLVEDKDSPLYWRVSITFTATAASWQLRVTPAGTTDPTQSTGTMNAALTGSAILWGAQMEVGSRPTSYIFTTSTTVTRGGDRPVMTGTNFSDWYNQSEGTFVAEIALVNPSATGATGRVLSTTSGGSANRVSDVFFNTTSWQCFNGTSSFTASGAPINYPINKVAVGYKSGDYTLTQNGLATVSRTDTLLNTPNLLNIGHIDGSSQPNGIIRRLRYWNTKLTAAQEQSLTAP